MELVLSIAIILTLLAIIIPTVGNYIQTARKTADKQTLVVLNDALNKYKTQGGDLSALTAGADIDNVLATLKTPITYWGLSQQFLNTSAPYAAADINAGGNGVDYVFTRYGSYMDMAAFLGAIKSSYAITAPDFDSWLEQAFIETGTTNYAVFTNPDTTALFGMFVRAANDGDDIKVWWDDGTTSSYNNLSASSDTGIGKDYGSAAARTIVMVGNIGKIYSSNDMAFGGAGSTSFGGDLSTMLSIYNISIYGNNTLGFNLSNLTNLSYLSIWGSNTLSGSVSGLTNLTYMDVQGSNTLSGDVSGLTNLVYLNVAGTNTLTGNLNNLTDLTYLITNSTSSYETNSIVNISGAATGLSVFKIGNQYTLNQSQVDTILINLDTNKNEIKPHPEKQVFVNGSNHSTPSATGLSAKTNLSNAGWYILTN